MSWFCACAKERILRHQRDFRRELKPCIALAILTASSDFACSAASAQVQSGA